MNLIKKPKKDEKIKWVGQADLEFEHSINQIAGDIPLYATKIDKIKEHESTQNFLLAALVTSLFIPIVLSISLYRNTYMNTLAIVMIAVAILFCIVGLIFLLTKCFIKGFALQSAKNTVKAYNRMHDLAKKKENN